VDVAKANPGLSIYSCFDGVGKEIFRGFLLIYLAASDLEDTAIQFFHCLSEYCSGKDNVEIL